MPAQKLSYKVDVDTGSAVRDLARLGDAGRDAGRDIADGFDQAESASKQALKALSTSLDQVEQDAKGLAQAVAAIKANLTVDVDDSKIAGFASDIRNKMGVAFDDVTADAKQFADVLERGVNMDRTQSAIRGVGDELDHVRSNSDQSRSVLANLAGNATQDLGELGGVVGSLGVGIGQLAEYAVDGNIAMSNLASVAGPMAALSVATLAVQSIMKNIADTKAFDKNQAKEFADAIGDVGDSYAAIIQLAESGDLQARLQGGGLLNEVFPRKETVDLVKRLDEVGLTIADVQEVIRSGATATTFADYLNGPTESAQELTAKLNALEAQGVDTDAVFQALREVTAAYTEANVDAATKARVLGSTMQTVNEQLDAMRIEADPLSVLGDRFVTLHGQVFDVQAIWKSLTEDLRDGRADFAGTGRYVDIMAEAMHLSTDEVLALATAQTTFQKASGGTGAAISDLIGDVDAFGRAWADAGRIMSSTEFNATGVQATADAMGQFFGEAEAHKDAVAGVQEALEGLASAAGEAGTILPNLSTGTGRAYWNALKDLGNSLLPEITQAFEDSNGSAAAFDDSMTGLYYRTLAQLSSQLGISTEDAALLLRQIGLVPENFETQYKLIGDADAQLKLQLLQSTIDKLPPSVMLDVQQRILAGDWQGALAAMQTAVNQHALTVKTQANTSGAKGDIAWFRTSEEKHPITIPTRGWWAGLWNAPSSLTVRTTSSSPTSVGGASVGTLAAPQTQTTTSMGGGGFGGPSFERRTVNLNVNVNAGVVGNRYDVERAVRAAVTGLTRMGRL